MSRRAHRGSLCCLLVAGIVLVNVSCGGGGGGSNPAGPPPCEDLGITASSIYRPAESRCTRDDKLLVRVSNQSCAPLTIDSASFRYLDPTEFCGDIEGFDIEDVNMIIPSKSGETVELSDVLWCCSTCSFTFTCDWEIEVTLDTSQGEIVARGAMVEKTFGTFCNRCTSSTVFLEGVSEAPGGERCEVGVGPRW